MCLILLADSKFKRASIIKEAVKEYQHQVQVVKSVRELIDLIDVDRKKFKIILINQFIKGGKKDFSTVQKIRKRVSRRTVIIGYSEDPVGGLRILESGGQDFAYQNGGILPKKLLSKINKWADISDKENKYFEDYRQLNFEIAAAGTME